MLDLYTNIKNERIKNGWTQTELALKVGYSDKSMIAKIEAGKVDLPQTKIRTFAEVFHCTESYLMGWDEEDDVPSTLTMDEKDLLKKYNELDDESKRQLILMVAFLQDQQNKDKKE